MGWELDRLQPYNETFYASEDNEFAWKMMIPPQIVLELYTAILSPKRGCLPTSTCTFSAAK